MYRRPLSVVRDERVTVLEALSVVVPTPVAPVIAPALDILIDGVERNFVNPVAETKLIPLIALVPVLVAAGKLIPFNTLVSFVLVALVREMLVPFTQQFLK